MTLLPPDALAHRLKSGLLSFPVTHFDADLQVDEARYRQHLAWQASFDVAGLFAAGGTGEGFSMTSEAPASCAAFAWATACTVLPVAGASTGTR